MIDLAESDMAVMPALTHNGGMVSFCEAETAMLVQYTDGSEKLSWSLNRAQTVVIGRSHQCDLTFPLRDISRKHAQIHWDGEYYVLEDLGSCNGTHVNNEPCLAAQRLQNGDEVKIGKEIIVYFVDDESTELLAQTNVNQGLCIDHTNRTLLVNGQPLLKALSPSQYKLVSLLFNAEERIVSRQEIVEDVWADESYDGVSEQAIDALARRIRLQIAEIDPDTDYLLTVRGHGFRMIRHPDHR